MESGQARDEGDAPSDKPKTASREDPVQYMPGMLKRYPGIGFYKTPLQVWPGGARFTIGGNGTRPASHMAVITYRGDPNSAQSC